MPRYKYCVVPKCLNTTSKTPDIIFFDLPRHKKVRKRWCKAMKRDPVKNPPFSEKSVRHVCQDHFNIETDTENFMQHRFQNVKLRLKQDVLPHKFDCQKPATSISTPASERAAKRQRQKILAELIKDQPSSSGLQIMQEDKATQTIQATFRSKGTDTQVMCRNFGCILKPSTQEVVCGAFFHNLKAEHQGRRGKEASCSDSEEEVENISEYECSETSDSDYEPIEDSDEDSKLLRKCIVKAIKINTLICLGIPQHASFLIDFLQEKSKCSELGVLITLKKVRKNETFENLAMLFGMSPSMISRIFKKTLPRLAGILQNFIIWPSDSTQIRKNLPIAFNIKNFKVQSIIDVLEIPIEKTSNPLHQNQTWSDYYKSNTIKYLVSCTPDGLINFISKGYGGRASDAMIFENSGFLNMLKPHTEVLSRRGFKNVSSLLEKKHCKLVYPPSVSVEHPMSACEVKETKHIAAAVRVHIERVIGRLRQFSILAKHTCVDYHLVHLFDYVLIIASGLVNILSKEYQ